MIETQKHEDGSVAIWNPETGARLTLTKEEQVQLAEALNAGIPVAPPLPDGRRLYTVTHAVDVVAKDESDAIVEAGYTANVLDWTGAHVELMSTETAKIALEYETLANYSQSDEDEEGEDEESPDDTPSLEDRGLTLGSYGS